MPSHRAWWTEPLGWNNSRTWLATPQFASQEQALAFAEAHAIKGRGYGTTVSDEPAGYERDFDIKEWQTKR